MNEEDGFVEASSGNWRPRAIVTMSSPSEENDESSFTGEVKKKATGTHPESPLVKHTRLPISPEPDQGNPGYLDGNRRRCSVQIVGVPESKIASDNLVRTRSSSFTRNGSGEDLRGDQAQSIEEFLKQKKKSSFKQRSRAVSIVGRKKPTHTKTPQTAPVISPLAQPFKLIRTDALGEDISEDEPSAHTPSETDSVERFPDVADNPAFSTSRRGSYLQVHEIKANRRLSRASSQSSHVGDDIYITPFAQILANLYIIRSNFIDLAGLPEEMHKGSLAGGGGTLSEEGKRQLAEDTVLEIDWCLEQLETMNSAKSVGDMAQIKFKNILIKELSDLSENSRSGSQVAEWVSKTYTDHTEIVDKVLELQVPVHAPSGSMGNVYEKLPKYGVSGPGVDEVRLGKILQDSIDEWSMNVFDLGQYAGGRPLVPLSYYIFQRRNLFKAFKIPPHLFINYVGEIENHYWSINPYHNAYHGADVLHATNFLLSCPPLQPVFTDLEVMASLFAAMVHDVDHPGRNNSFLVATEHHLALLYNDVSVLENHHLAVAFKIMSEPKNNFLLNMDSHQKQAFRKMVIDLVLATDMAKHLHHMGKLKTMVETKKVASDGILLLDKYSEKSEVLQCLVHCADLSNPSKDVQLATEWAHRVLQEFFLQGDEERERGLPISPLMDRQSVIIEKCQASFIEFVVYPLWEAWSELVYPHGGFILERLDIMMELWNDKIPRSPLPSNSQEVKDEGDSTSISEVQSL